MGYPTPIEWTDATWNPIGGCSIASPGCKPCYAQQLAGTRLSKHPLYKGTTDNDSGRPVFNGHMTAAADNADVWSWPLRWRGVAADQKPVLGWGARSTIFVGDMADLFHENRPIAAIDKVIGVIAQSTSRPNPRRRHVHQLLTKRAEVMAAYWREVLAGRTIEGCISLAGPQPLIWLGTSTERQKEFDERWPHLRRLAELGFIVFISYEPALGPLKLPRDFLELGRRAQVIAGGVSGRWQWAPHPDWFRSVRDQCADAGVAFFFKQWGEWRVAPTDQHRDHEHVFLTRDWDHVRLGKKAAGNRLLDGREWNEFPVAA